MFASFPPTAVADGAAPPPPPPPSDSDDDDVPDKLQPFQGGACYTRWYQQIVSTLGIKQQAQLDDIINKGSLKPNWEAQGLNERQVIRRRKQDRKFYAILPGSLNSDTVQQVLLSPLFDFGFQKGAAAVGNRSGKLVYQGSQQPRRDSRERIGRSRVPTQAGPRIDRDGDHGDDATALSAARIHGEARIGA